MQVRKLDTPQEFKGLRLIIILSIRETIMSKTLLQLTETHDGGGQSRNHCRPRNVWLPNMVANAIEASLLQRALRRKVAVVQQGRLITGEERPDGVTARIVRIRSKRRALHK